MRKKKSCSNFKQLEIQFPLFTEPNQSFTPRQIIDQFARGECSAHSFEPSDNIDDDSYSDDHMVDHVLEFEDEFSALEYMKTTKVKSKNEHVSVENDKEGSSDPSGDISPS